MSTIPTGLCSDLLMEKVHKRMRAAIVTISPLLKTRFEKHDSVEHLFEMRFSSAQTKQSEKRKCKLSLIFIFHLRSTIDVLPPGSHTNLAYVLIGSHTRACLSTEMRTRPITGRPMSSEYTDMRLSFTQGAIYHLRLTAFWRRKENNWESKEARKGERGSQWHRYEGLNVQTHPTRARKEGQKPQHR